MKHWKQISIQCHIVLHMQQTSPLSAIIGAVGGALSVGTGTAIVIGFVVVLWKRRRIKRGTQIHKLIQLCIKLQHEYIWLLKQN